MYDVMMHRIQVITINYLATYGFVVSKIIVHRLIMTCLVVCEMIQPIQMVHKCANAYEG